MVNLTLKEMELISDLIQQAIWEEQGNVEPDQDRVKELRDIILKFALEIRA